MGEYHDSVIGSGMSRAEMDELNKKYENTRENPFNFPARSGIVSRTYDGLIHPIFMDQTSRKAVGVKPLEPVKVRRSLRRELRKKLNPFSGIGMLAVSVLIPHFIVMHGRGDLPPWLAPAALAPLIAFIIWGVLATKYETWGRGALWRPRARPAGARSFGIPSRTARGPAPAAAPPRCGPAGCGPAGPGAGILRGAPVPLPAWGPESFPRGIPWQSRGGGGALGVSAASCSTAPDPAAEPARDTSSGAFVRGGIPSRRLWPGCRPGGGRAPPRNRGPAQAGRAGASRRRPRAPAEPGPGTGRTGGRIPEAAARPRGTGAVPGQVDQGV